MDSPVENNTTEKIVFYGGFWRRVAAHFVDGLFVGVFIFPLSWYDLTSLKSYPVYIVLSLLGALYKPLMEYKYGATLGKMALGLKCVNLNYEKITLGEAFGRNLVFLVPGIITIILNYFLFTSSDFADATTWGEVSHLLVQLPFVTSANKLAFLFWIVDAVVLGTDNHKRSLHDRWANTQVIYFPETEE